MFEFLETYWILGGGTIAMPPVYLAEQSGSAGQLELTIHSRQAERFPSQETAQLRRRVLQQSDSAKGSDGSTLRPLRVTITTRINEAEEVA